MKRSVHATLLASTLCVALAPGCGGALTTSAADAGVDAATTDAPGPDATPLDAAGLDANASDASDASTSPSDGGGDLCKLPKEVGPCDAAIPRFWFNAASGRCERFIYGGCGANANNFPSIEACARACAPSVANPCTITDCDGDLRCVFQGTTPRCAAPCDDAGTCGAPLACSCGASCSGCRDCIRVCF